MVQSSVCSLFSSYASVAKAQQRCVHAMKIPACFFSLSTLMHTGLVIRGDSVTGKRDRLTTAGAKE